MEFNTLPLEVHLEIFSHLSVCDVMRIRRVCRLWKGLINGEFKFKRLRCQQLYKPFEMYHLKSYDFGFTSTRSFLDYTSTNSKFSRVRYLNANLSANEVSELEDAFGFLNSFKSLKEVLFVCHFFRSLDGVQKQFVVSLPLLKKANFHLRDFKFAIREANASVLLDLPNLVCLSIDSLAGITIGHPEKLRTLATTSLFDGLLDYSKFTSLTNIFTGRRDLPSISASFLERLSSLRELHVSFFGDLPRDYRLPEPSLGRTKLKIFFYGFEVSAKEIESEGAQWVNSFHAFLGMEPSENTAQLIARNLHRSVDNNPHVESIDYNAIASELDYSVFGVIPRKFPKIVRLRIFGTVVDQNRLLKFIDKFKMTGFYFRRTSLPQRFFEKLAENCPFISSLTITEPTMSILSGDFDFCFKFKNLKSLCFRDCPLSLDFVVRAMKELKSLSSLTISQSEIYQFSLWASQKFTKNHITLYVDVRVPTLSRLRCQIPTEEALDWVNVLQRQLNADGAVCPRELQILLQCLKFEKENALFWMRKYLYDQRHSICLSKQQMSLLNHRH